MKKAILLLVSFLSASVFAQSPVADFTISPNPVCSGQANIIQITDQSTGGATAWSYTVAGGFGPGNVLTTQNPTLTINAQGIYTITLVVSGSTGTSVPVSHTLQVLQSPAVAIIPQNQNTCIGGSVSTLSVVAQNALTGLSFAWSTGATTSTMAVTPTTTSVYTCVITSTNGCSTIRTSTITIGQPTVNIGSFPYSICPGNNSTLTATGSGGGPYSYTWSTAANTRTISASSPGVISVSVTNAVGCVGVNSFTLGSSTTLSLTAIASTTMLCAGNISTLSASGASSYSWSSGGATPNTTVAPVANATYTVAGIFGACTGSAVISLSVNASPTIITSSSSNSICSGQSVTLTANGATTYTWLPANVNQTISVSPVATSIYTVRGNNPGCATRGATIGISVLPSPAVIVASSASIVCVGESVALAASGANTYSWNNGSTSAVVVVTVSNSSSYTVSGTSLNGCSSSVVFTQPVDQCTGIKDFNVSEIQFSVYPNPTTDNVFVNLSGDYDLTISNFAGQVVYSIKGDLNNNGLEIKDLQPGLYIFSISVNGTTNSKKILVTGAN